MITFFFGGTFSSKGDAVRTLYGAGDPVAGTAQCRAIATAMTGTQINTVLDWPGGFAYKWWGFPRVDPRQKGADKAAKTINAWVKDALAAVQGPVTIGLVGFSHGGNTAILALDQVLQGMRGRDPRLRWKLLTISTPPVTQYKEEAAGVWGSASVRWCSVSEIDDPVVSDLAGLTDYLEPMYDSSVTQACSYEHVTHRALQTSLAGIDAHDRFAGSPEVLRYVQGLQWQ